MFFCSFGILTTGSMGLVHLPTFTIKIHQMGREIYHSSHVPVMSVFVGGSSLPLDRRMSIVAIGIS